MRVFLQLALLLIFLIFFGVPAIEKYQKKETIIVSSKKFTNGIEAPALTIMGVDNNGLGWKIVQDGLGTWARLKFDEHCAKLNIITIEECIKNDTYHLTDVVKGAQFGPSQYDESNPLNSSALFWTEDLTTPNLGKHFKLKFQKELLTSSNEDLLVMFLRKNMSFTVFVHDENFFLVNINPLGPPSNQQWFKQPSQSFYLDLSCKMFNNSEQGQGCAQA